MRRLSLIALCVGALMFVGGVVLALLFKDAEGIMGALPVIIIGLGSILIGTNLMVVFRLSNSKLAKELEINEKDERNIRVREKSGYSTWFITQLALVAMLISLSIMDYDVPAWIALAVLAIHNGSLLLGIAVHNKKI